MQIAELIPTPACRRQSARDSVVLAGSAFALSRSRSVIISDLSHEGARLDGHDLPTPGDDIFLVVGPFDTMASVVWRCGDHCGIRFDDAAADDILVQMKQEAEWTSVAGWYR